MSLSGTLSTPFLESTLGASATEGVWDVVIDGRGFLIDRDPQKPTFLQKGVDVVRQRVGNRGESTPLLTPPEVWRHLVEDWSFGSGQREADREDSIPGRFYRSQGVNPWERWELSLLPDVEQVEAVTVNGFLSVAGGRLGVFDGTAVSIYLSLTTAPVAVTLPSPVLDVTSDGSRFLVACVDGVVRAVSSTGTVTSFATLASVSRLTYSKGRVVAAALNVLHDITSGTPVTIFTHPFTAHRWVAFSETQSFIYVLGGAGDRWQVSRISIQQDATTLDPPIVSAVLPDGEVGHSLYGYLNFLAVGTSSGVRFGQPDGQGDVALGSVIPTESPVLAFEGQDRFVWYGLSDYADGVTGLGRMDLSRFTSDLTPAYASDLMAPTTGQIVSIVTFDGKTVFSVGGEAVYAEADAMVDSGWLETGALTFDTADPKTGHYAALRHEPLAGGISLSVGYDGGAQAAVGGSEVEGSSGSGNLTLDGNVFRKATMRLTLTPSGEGVSPTLTRLELRVTGVLGRHTQWEIPLVMADTLDLDGNPTPRDPAADAEHLLRLLETGRTFRLTVNGQSFTAYAHDYQIINDKPSESGNGYQGTFVMVIREMR